jgi:hypothetical protein
LIPACIPESQEKQMTKIFTLACFGITLSATHAMVQPSQEVAIEKEPHHSVVFENAEVRVFRLVLQPNESTLPHRHHGPYAFLSLHDVEMQNEVPGRAPVKSDLTAGDLHTSKGGFLLAERNMSTSGADLIVVERMGTPGAPFGSPMAGFRVHEAATGELFEGASMRAYSTRMAVGGRTEVHEEIFDRLIVALTDLRLQGESEDHKHAEISMKSGEVRWISKGTGQALANLGDAPCTFITFEFN